MTKKFKPLAILHWHGWGNDLAFPYSYDWRAKLAANELGLFQEFASEMAATNGADASPQTLTLTTDH